MLFCRKVVEEWASSLAFGVWGLFLETPIFKVRGKLNIGAKSLRQVITALIRS